MADAQSFCPRCGGSFHCGANDAAPCACGTVQLDDAALADLRIRYTGCLCLACLREVVAPTLPLETDR